MIDDHRNPHKPTLKVFGNLKREFCFYFFITHVECILYTFQFRYYNDAAFCILVINTHSTLILHRYNLFMDFAAWKRKWNLIGANRYRNCIIIILSIFIDWTIPFTVLNKSPILTWFKSLRSVFVKGDCMISVLRDDEV